MKPRMTLLMLSLSCCLLAVSAGPAQRDLSQVEIRPRKVAGTVWMLEGAGGNIGVSAGEDGLLMVDDQFAPLAPKIRAALERIGGGSSPTFLLNTHWHPDHTGGNPVFGPESIIISQENVRRRLEEGMDTPQRRRPAMEPAGLPVITFHHSLDIHFNGERIRVHHFRPAHTDGDAIVWFQGSNVIHMGDLFFAGMFPYVDVDSGGDVEGLEKVIAHLLEELPEGVRLIPGHGSLAGRGDLEAYHEMLRDSIARVRRWKERGWSVERMVEKGLPKRYEGWAHDFISEERWIRILDRSLGD